MKQSLQWRLSIMLGGAILVLGLVAAVGSFVLAYDEAKEFQDDTLRQIAFLETQDTGIPTRTNASKNNAGLAAGDPESRITVIRLPPDSLPAWLSGTLSPGFHTFQANGDRMRIFVKEYASRKIVVVAQPTDARDEIAMNSALRTLIPLLLLLPLMAWLIVRIVRRELAPISHLATYLDAQPASRPQSLSDQGVPDEVAPFIRAINRLFNRIGNLMDQQQRFIADAAHELRSPLTALSIQVQNLKRAGSMDDMRERVLPLQAGIERTRKLTEQLLSLAGTQAGTMKSEVVDVSLISRELIAEYLPLAEAKSIDLGLEEDAPLRLTGAPDILRLLLRNALENALKYTPDGGEVTLKLYADDENDVVEIVDNGPGIPASERKQVFDPFYRISGSTADGSGLGLAIAMEAAASLGGSVSLLDRPQGSGLVFRYRQIRKR